MQQVHSCVRRPEMNLKCHSLASAHLVLLRQGCFGGSLCWIGRHVWVASETQRSAGLCHPSAKITNARHHAQFFTWVLRVKLGFSMIAWQAFLLTGPPRYFLFSFCGDDPQVSPPSMFQYYYYSIIFLIYKPFPMDSITLNSE